MDFDAINFIKDISNSAMEIWESGMILVIVFWVKILAAILSLFFAAALIYLLRKTSYFNYLFLTDFKDFTHPAPSLPKKRLVKRWEGILGKIESEKESDWKQAIAEADAILDDLLKNSGYEGEDIDERLKQVDAVRMKNIDQIWRAHKVRNSIDSGPEQELTKEGAKEIIEIYQKTFENFELI